MKFYRFCSEMLLCVRSEAPSLGSRVDTQFCSLAASLGSWSACPCRSPALAPCSDAPHYYSVVCFPLWHVWTFFLLKMKTAVRPHCYSLAKLLWIAWFKLASTAPNMGFGVCRLCFCFQMHVTGFRWLDFYLSRLRNYFRTWRSSG